MRELAGGALDIDIPHRTRRDELGEMARAVGVFRDHMSPRGATDARSRKIERQQAAQDKHAALVRMAETIESETRTALEQIGKRTTT